MDKVLRLKKILVNGFGCLPAGFEVTFDRGGINLICGPNESGKSTTMNAILGGIFGDYEVRHYEPWGSKPDSPFSVEIETENASGDHIFFNRDFKNAFSEVYSVDSSGKKRLLFRGEVKPQGRKASNQEYAELLESLLGFSSSDFFLQINFIGQEDMVVDLENSFLQQVGSGENENLTIVLEGLKERHKALTRESKFFGRAGRNDRKIELLEQEIGDLDTRRDALLQRHTESIDLREKQEKLQYDIQQKAGAITEIEDTLRLEDRLVDISETLRQRQERLLGVVTQRRRVEEKVSNKEEIEETIRKNYQVFSDAPENLDEHYNELLQERHSLKEREQELSEREEEISTIESELKELETKCEQERRLIPITREGLQGVESTLSLYRDYQEAQEKHDMQKSTLRPVWKSILVPSIAAIFGLVLIVVGVALKQSLVLIPGLLVVGGSVAVAAYMASRTGGAGQYRDYLADEVREARSKYEKARERIEKIAPGIFDRFIADNAPLATLRKNVEERAAVEEKYETKKRDLEKAHERLSRFKEENGVRKENLDSLVHRWGKYIVGDDVLESQRLYRSFLEFRGRRNLLNEQLKNEESLDGLKKKETELELQFRSSDADLQEFIKQNPPMAYMKEAMDKDPAKVTRELQEKREGLVRLKDELGVFKEQLRDIRVKLEFESRDSEAYSEETLGEIITEKQKQLRMLKKQSRAIEIAVDTLREAMDRFENEYADVMINRAAELFSRVTNGRYTSLEVKDEGLQAISSDGETVFPDEMSQGARDQLYLCVRLALARVLSERMRIPLLLDDPFVHCDNTRLKAIRKVLDELAAQGWQIILLTCHTDRFRKWGNMVCELS
jgi:DNA repair exonuclease SbcCD ATPase subunit